MARPEDIVRHEDPDPDRDPFVGGPPEATTVEIVAPDPGWPARFAALAAGIRRALGPRALTVEHVGSTSVPGLAAKDVVDIDLVVADPGDEDSYVPALEAAGWRLTIREPWWQGHRMLRCDDPAANLHVFGPDAAEPVRHRLFRDRLREHPEERARYEAAKRAAVPGGGRVMDYNARKQDVIREIYDRAFRAAGLL